MTDPDEEFLVEFLRSVDEEQLTEIIDALEKSPIAKKAAGECRRCDYVAIGNDMNEILLDLGMHVYRRHPEHFLFQVEPPIGMRSR